MSLQSPYPPFNLPTQGYVGPPGVGPVNGNLFMYLGICSAGAITNPAFSLCYPQTGILNLQTVTDWGTGTYWLFPVSLHWTGTAWCGFTTLYVDVGGKLNSGGQYIVGFDGQIIVPQPPATAVQGHLFADLPDLLAIGVGINITWNGSFYACGVSLTQFVPYNNQKPIAKSGIVFPYAAPNSGIVSAGTTPTPPYQTINNASNQLVPPNRSPLVIMMSGSTQFYTWTTPQYYFATLEEYTNNLGSSFIPKLTGPASAGDYPTEIGAQKGPSALSVGGSYVDTSAFWDNFYVFVDVYGTTVGGFQYASYVKIVGAYPANPPGLTFPDSGYHFNSSYGLPVQYYNGYPILSIGGTITNINLPFLGTGVAALPIGAGSTPSAYGGNFPYFTWAPEPSIFELGFAPYLTTVASWVPVGTINQYGNPALYPKGFLNPQSGNWILSPTSYCSVKLGKNNLYVWCLGGNGFGGVPA